MIEEYYVEYYDGLGHRFFTRYYTNRNEADTIVKSLEEQGYEDVTIHIFRY